MIGLGCDAKVLTRARPMLAERPTRLQQRRRRNSAKREIAEVID